MACDYKKALLSFCHYKKVPHYLPNADLLVHSDHRPLLKFSQDTLTKTKDKCSTWGLEAIAIPRRIKVHHFKGIANVLADSVSRLRAVGLYHDIDLKDHQQEISAPFEPLPPVEPATHMLFEVNETFIVPNVENLTQTYDELHDLPPGQTTDDVKLSLENVSPAYIPQFEQSLMSLPEIYIRKSKNNKRMTHFAKT